MFQILDNFKIAKNQVVCIGCKCKYFMSQSEAWTHYRYSRLPIIEEQPNKWIYNCIAWNSFGFIEKINPHREQTRKRP